MTTEVLGATQPVDATTAEMLWSPLTSAQRGIWFAHQLGVDGEPTSVYNTAEYVVLTGQVDLPKLLAAIRHVLTHTEALRMCFRDSAAGPEFAIRPNDTTWQRDLDLAVLDLQDQPEPRAAALSHLQADWARPLDLLSEQMVGNRLLLVGPNEVWWYQRAHHIAVDGFGASLLFTRVAAAYSASVQGKPFPPLPDDSLDAVAAADRSYEGSAERDADREHWRRHLADSSVASLSLRPSTPQQPVEHFLRHRLSVPTAVCEAVAAAGKALAPTTWMDIVLAATSAYQARMTGVGSGRIGLPLMRRLGTPAARTVCTTMNVVAAVVQCRADSTIADLLAAARSEQERARRHGRFREEELRHLARAQGQHALYGSQLNLMPFYLNLRFAGLDAELHNVSAGPVDDLTICLRGTPGAGPVQLELDANPARYGLPELELHAERLTTFWQRFATAAATDPEQLVYGLPLATEREHRTIRTRFNDTAHPLTPGTLLEIPTGSDPTSSTNTASSATSAVIAVRCADEQLTRAEFEHRVHDLAHRLHARGVRAGQLVAVAFPRSVRLLVAIHAVVRIGAVYLPIDVDDPPQRREAALIDARPVLLLADPELSAPDELTRWQGTAFDAPTGAVPNHCGEPVESVGWVPPRPDDPAYVIYTSGSTGAPKGVVVGHRAIHNRLAWMQHRIPLGPDDRTLLKTSIGFDVSVWELFWPVAVGSPLVIAEPGVHRDPEALIDLIERERITTVHFVPSMLVAFVEALEARGSAARSLRRIVCSGEALSSALARRAENLTGAEIINLYGPTEAAVDVSEWTFDPAGDDDWVPIGRPVWNTDLLVLDEQGRLAPIGAPGELHIGGVQLADGYLGRPSLTADRFITTTDGKRLYRTGDRARFRSDGALEYLGRMDRQVKIRGQRVEPGEVEGVLSAAAGVAAVAVTAQREAASTSAVLVAYLVLEDGADPGTVLTTVRALARQRLTAAMCPAGYLILADPPLTSSGKLDLKALPPVDLGATEQVGAAVPQGPLAEQLCRAMAEALGVRAVGAHDDFFALGGHSLAGVRLVSQLRSQLGVSLSLADLFVAPTPASLADLITGGRPTDDLAPLLALRATGARPPLFCVHPAGGLGWCYAGLLATLPADQPVYALQARGLHPDDSLPGSLGELAEDYLDQIMPLAGDSPIQLLGWSIGGMVAHEMAARLERRGRTASLVVLLDDYPGDQWRHLPEPTEDDALQAILRIAAADDGTGGLTREETVHRLRAAGSALAQLSPATVDAMIGIVGNCARIVRSAEHSTLHSNPYPSAHSGAQSGAQSGPNDPTRVLFVEAAGSREQGHLDPNGWAPLVTGRITRHVLPMRHQELVSAAALKQVAEWVIPALAAPRTPESD